MTLPLKSDRGIVKGPRRPIPKAVRDMLEKHDWTELAPGRAERKTVLIHNSIYDSKQEVYTETIYYCRDCMVIYPMMVILDDVLWHEVNGSHHGVLCFVCIERRMGRKLVTDDLKNCPANRELRYILSTR